MDSVLVEAMIRLLKVYELRRDLREAFPEVMSKDYGRLLEWSCGVVQKKWDDSEYVTLKPYSDQFESLRSLRETQDGIINSWARSFSRTAAISDKHPSELSDSVLSHNLKKFLSTSEARLDFPYYEKPVVSVVIVTYNQGHYSYQCLRNLLADSLPPIEVIIVDNASSDETPLLLRMLHNVKVIRNERNEYFPRACNQGARAAKGKHLLFLNNDIFVDPGCVSWLSRTMEYAPDIGAAGARLVWRDGRLQEAGSIIWRDGSTLGYGRGDDPSKPEYCYTRDVDYCSAACLMISREVFNKLGGFDEVFTPGYYEDADICLRMWDAGFRVVYQPLAVATHIEFASTSFENATKLMEKNKAIFVAKHHRTLEEHLPYTQTNEH